MALAIAGRDPGHNIVVQPKLLTQTVRRAGDIKTVEDLNAKLPVFGHSDAATAAWIPTN